MSKSFLSVLGLLSLLGLLAAAVVGLTLVKDRVRVVVQDENTADAPRQQVASLRDELQQMQRDLRALTDALGRNLQQLAETQSADGEARAATLLRRFEQQSDEARALRAAVAESRVEQEQLRATLRAVESALRTVAAPAAVRSAAPSQAATAQAVDLASEAASGTQAAGRPAAEPRAVPPARGEPPAPSASTAPAEVPSPPSRRRSAFAFELPSQSFRFDLAQRFELLPSLSRVGFDAKSTLHDFTGVTSKLSGAVHMNLAAPAQGCSGEITVDAASLDTGLAGRNDNMREHLLCAQHQRITFSFTGMRDGAVVDAGKQTLRGTVQGRMTIRGQTREVAMPAQIRVDDSKRVIVEGEMPLKLSDYGVPVPSQLGLINMQDEVKIWVALQARALGAVKAR